MLNLYMTLVRPHVEYGSSAWNLYYKKDKELLEKIQHMYTKIIYMYYSISIAPIESEDAEALKMIRDMRDRTYETRLKCLRLWKLEERRNRCTRDITRYFFSNKVINRWKCAGAECSGRISHQCFQEFVIEKVRSNRMGFFMD